MIYPDDDTGETLRRMNAKGDDMSRARDIDFSVVFADEDSAEQFAEHFRGLGHKASVRFPGPKKDLPWDVTVVNHMAPSYEGISEFEELLQDVADTLGGSNDGWGCFSNLFKKPSA